MFHQYRESQILLRFVLRLAISKIFCNFFHFPTGHNVKFQSFSNLLKFYIQNSKITFIWTVKRNSGKKFGRKRILRVEEAAFEEKIQVHRMTTN